MIKALIFGEYAKALRLENSIQTGYVNKAGWLIIKLGREKHRAFSRNEYLEVPENMINESPEVIKLCCSL